MAIDATHLYRANYREGGGRCRVFALGDKVFEPESRIWIMEAKLAETHEQDEKLSDDGTRF